MHARMIGFCKTVLIGTKTWYLFYPIFTDPDLLNKNEDGVIAWIFLSSFLHYWNDIFFRNTHDKM